MPKSEVHNIDCLEYMRTLPDKAFALAVADPPYGIGAATKEFIRPTRRGKSLGTSKDYGTSDWDNRAMSKEFFDELRRVSENQIIWGANHFISRLPYDSPCWIVWDKQTGDNDYADCELAWTSFDTSVRKFTFMWKGMFQENMAHKEIRIHPTQKPVALYGWLLQKYGKSGG